ncbi:MAG: SDR family NAD(P)-dependent oxidoreductase [Woeseiaceae bacterium]|nr:SDR family NAD(P)-dependent oxidoreductase [Woeseiaceae bacterium]
MTDSNDVPAIAELLNLEGQRVLVTGASGNIGRGIATRLAQAGADIVVHFHGDEEGAGETVAAVRELGRSADKMRADLGDEHQVARCFEAFKTPVTRVVNNAGNYPVQAFTEMTAAEWREVVAANLDSAVNVSKYAIRAWRAQNLAGAIVNIASIEGSDPAMGHSHYASSKAALLMLTRSLTLEVGRDGIRVNAVSPGLISREDIDKNWPEGVASWREHAPLQRMGDAADVADAVLFLLAPASRWISGVNLVVDGGMSCASRW